MCLFSSTSLGQLGNYGQFNLISRNEKLIIVKVFLQVKQAGEKLLNPEGMV